MPRSETIHFDGMEIGVEHVKSRSGGGVRLDVSDETRRWRIDVTEAGDLKDVVTTWEDGELADLDEPDWLDVVLGRLAAPA